EHDERRDAPYGRAALERDGRAAHLEARTQARARIEALAAGVRRVAACPDCGKLQPEASQRRSRGGQLLVAHALEIQGLERFARRNREARVVGDALERRGAVALTLGEERLREPLGDLRL